MKKLQVIYNGWGERWPLGTLAESAAGSGQGILFEYSQAAMERGLQLSPMHHPLPRAGSASTAFQGVAYAHGLPGFIADSLPDGWGMLLMDRALRKLGRDPRSVSVLERLAIVGERAMGALSFEPSDEDILPAERLELKALAQQVVALQTDHNAGTDKADAQLRHLMQLGGSPQGARPKVLVDFNARTGQISSGLPLVGSATPWLMKFPAESEHREVCAVEELYARVARAGGMEMPKSRSFELGAKHSAFGVERFDRVVLAKGKERSVMRVPIMSMAAYLHADHRLPSLDYETILLATLQITGDQREVAKAFDRCIFNVLMHNRDDHAKNFAFRMNEQGLWKLSPAFDLTYSFGPGGEHSTSVAGHGKSITRENLLRVAKTAGIALKKANEQIDHWCAKLKSLDRWTDGLDIRRNTFNELQKSTQDRILLISIEKRLP
jgi:serine/threonine-protein kinase HipA